jgi:hypothetical protein
VVLCLSEHAADDGGVTTVGRRRVIDGHRWSGLSRTPPRMASTD